MTSVLDSIVEDSLVESDDGELSALTSDLEHTVISHTHGRLRREERGIAKAELQAAVAKGRCEPSRPSRSGRPRFKFTYQGVVYITDETKRHEITSWRLLDIVPVAEAALLATETSFKSHAVFIVDHSGSMRQQDVYGYADRTEAVYKCLIRDFLQPQLDLLETYEDVLGDAVISLITMSDRPSLLLKRKRLGPSLKDNLEELAASSAASHGNYLPALELLETLLVADDSKAEQVMVFFLSDGAESDHSTRQCMHGVSVWQEDAGAAYSHRRPLQQCASGETRTCRAQIKQDVRLECLKRIQLLGDLIGQDKISFTTVGFGPAKEDFVLLRQMASVLPKGSFQKLGLEAHKLGLAFTSLTSTLTTMRTVLGGSKLTPNKMKGKVVSGADDVGWDVYTNTKRTLLHKFAYSPIQGELVDVALLQGADGVAMKKAWFAKGSERLAFMCKEVDGSLGEVGFPLVAKEVGHQELLQDIRFHKRMAKMQHRAQELADRFNSRVRDFAIDDEEAAGIAINFVPCVIYEVKDTVYGYPNEVAWIFAEPYLDGKFRKWNNNAGKVYSHDNPNVDGERFSLDTVPQAFSHYTFSVTDRRELVCDLQGVWNAVDGFEFTDPAIHNDDDRRKRHRTDRGTGGMEQFCKTHVCSLLCAALGLDQLQ